jgi:hypothetical protein
MKMLENPPPILDDDPLLQFSTRFAEYKPASTMSILPKSTRSWLGFHCTNSDCKIWLTQIRVVRDHLYRTWILLQRLSCGLTSPPDSALHFIALSSPLAWHQGLFATRSSYVQAMTYLIAGAHRWYSVASQATRPRDLQVWLGMHCYFERGRGCSVVQACV